MIQNLTAIALGIGLVCAAVAIILATYCLTTLAAEVRQLKQQVRDHLRDHS